MALKSKVEILNALQAKLEALTFTDQDNVDAAFVGQTIVDSVQLFDEGDAEAAARKLLDYSERMAALVPMGTDLKTEIEHGALRTEASFRLLVMLTETAYESGNREAVFGSSSYRGTLNMGEAVIKALYGELALALGSTSVVPTQGQSLRIAEDEASLSQSREGYLVEFQISLGVLKTTLSRGRRRN